MLSQPLSAIDALNLLVAGLLYSGVYAIGRWKLLPRLCPGFSRFASLMLGLHILVFALALAAQPSSDYDKWLWHLTGGEEWNIPSQVGTTQLAIVIGAAWIACWLARAQPAWKRLHLLLTGFVVAVILVDEQFQVHEVNREVVYAHIALGLLLAAATYAAARRSPKAERIWHLCLVAGLAVSAVGAVVMDSAYDFCHALGIAAGCPRLSLVEESLELLGIWIALIAILGLFQAALPAPSRSVRRAIYALPAIWALLILVFALYPHLELRLHVDSSAIEFDDDIRIGGYTLDTGGGAARLRLYASARQKDYIGVGYSIHLVDQASGESIASQDEWANRYQSLWYFGPDYEPLYRQTMAVPYPPQTPTNRALWVVLSLWRKKWDGSYPRLDIVSSDRRLLSEEQVALGELVLPESPSAPQTAPLAAFANGFALDAARLPAKANAGASLDIVFQWRAESADGLDYTQFLHLSHADSGAQWGFDQPPLGDRLPTRLWYAGLADAQTWQATLPADLAAGHYEVFTGLYRQSDLRRLPAVDAAGNLIADARVRIGVLEISDG